MTETHYVVYAVDEDYWIPLYVSIHSLVSNNPDTSLGIFVLYAEREESFFDNIADLTAEYDDVTVTGIEVDKEAVGEVPTRPIATRISARTN
jgi:lipopolysaccharide biosynthesis glycosyltransferase